MNCGSSQVTWTSDNELCQAGLNFGVLFSRVQVNLTLDQFCSGIKAKPPLSQTQVLKRGDIESCLVQYK